jgi:hypothetical protein
MPSIPSNQLWIFGIRGFRRKVVKMRKKASTVRAAEKAKSDLENSVSENAMGEDTHSSASLLGLAF